MARRKTRKSKWSYKKYKKLIGATIGLAMLWGQAYGWNIPATLTPDQITALIMGAGTLAGIWGLENAK